MESIVHKTKTLKNNIFLIKNPKTKKLQQYGLNQAHRLPLSPSCTQIDSLVLRSQLPIVVPRSAKNEFPERVCSPNLRRTPPG